MGYQIQVFSLSKVVFYDSKRSGVHTVSQCDLIDFFAPIREDILKTSYAYYFAELVDTFTGENDKGERIFDLLLNSLELLKSKASPKRIARIFEIKLLMFSGLMASEYYSRHYGGSRKILSGTANFIGHVERAPYEKLDRIKVSRDVGEELEVIMKELLDYHLETRLRSLEFLEKMESGV